MLMPAVAWFKGTCMLMTMSLPYSRGGSPGAPIDAEVRHLGMITNWGLSARFRQCWERLLEEAGEGGRWGRLGSEALGCWVGAGVGVGAAHPSALPESVAVKEAATPIW